MIANALRHRRFPLPDWFPTRLMTGCANAVLSALGADSWLALGPRPVRGSIVLVHSQRQ